MTRSALMLAGAVAGGLAGVAIAVLWMPPLLVAGGLGVVLSLAGGVLGDVLGLDLQWRSRRRRRAQGRMIR